MLKDTGDRWLSSSSRTHQEVPTVTPTPVAIPGDVPDLVDPTNEEILEDVDQPHVGYDEEGESFRLPPISACQAVHNSRIEGIPIEWEDTEGPHQSHPIREQSRVGEVLHVNYGLMTHAI